MKVGDVYYDISNSYRESVIIKALFDNMVTYFQPRKSDKYNTVELDYFNTYFTKDLKPHIIKRLKKEIESKKEYIEKYQRDLATIEKELASLIGEQHD
jgi:hypothetical protein